jgi:TRAP-type mannitol/chloroaromatic compound transport system substrate-binding protein
MIKTTSLLLATLTLVACGSGSDNVPENTLINEPVNLKMASTYPSTLIILGTMAKRFEEQIEIISGGNIKFRFFEPGALAPPL